MPRPKRTDVRQFILWNIPGHQSDVAALTSEKFGLSRQAVNNHIRALTAEGLVRAAGKTRGRAYFLIDFLNTKQTFDLTKSREEHIVWRDQVAPHLRDLPKNVFEICEYGFSEMFNNAIDHSLSPKCTVWIRRNAVRVGIRIIDWGIGIFNKIQAHYSLDDPRHALLELSKGKTTSDPDHHTGEGIFFTSRMFDEFAIWSYGLYYKKERADDGWLIEIEDMSRRFVGTWVDMEISYGAKQTPQEIFKRYENDDHGFTRTHVPLLLAKYEGEQLVSRSQAKRLLARVDQFKEALLDFRGIQNIGRAFADEVFRVYHQKHPDILIIPLNANREILDTIKGVFSDGGTAEKEAS